MNSTDRKSFTLVNRMSASQGGTFASMIEPGDQVATHNGIKAVQSKTFLRSENAYVVCLIFADDFKALMPAAAAVQVVDVAQAAEDSNGVRRDAEGRALPCACAEYGEECGECA
jgi:hypothetical protein